MRLHQTADGVRRQRVHGVPPAPGSDQRFDLAGQRDRGPPGDGRELIARDVVHLTFLSGPGQPGEGDDVSLTRCGEAGSHGTGDLRRWGAATPKNAN